MITEIIMPKMGQTMEEGTITSWVKQEGEHVERGEVFLIIETDKAEIEVEAAFTGTLRKILRQEGQTVPVLTVIALAGDPDEPLPPLEKYLGEAARVAIPTPRTADVTAVAPQAIAPPTRDSAASVRGQPGASPRAKKLAKSLMIPLAVIRGTGPGGRIVERDVQQAHEEYTRVNISPVAKKIAYQKGIDIRRISGTGPRGKIVKEDLEKAPTVAPSVLPTVIRTERMSPIRRITAKRMAESKFTAPHYYVTVETDMAEALRVRENLLPDIEREYGVRFTVTDMLVKATAIALQDFPLVNARVSGETIEYLKEINIGVAVALEEGLIVPVLRDLAGKSLGQIADAARELVTKARDRKLMPDDFVGGTFTVSNMGTLGVDEFSAIINPPESAILAVGRAVERPVVISGAIEIRPMMKMTMSSDHRLIDGAVAARFLGHVKELLESPDSLKR
jgi:pyruvate dehydrogenase E2 component (dihydrolipoamide acetyltransferase)